MVEHKKDENLNLILNYLVHDWILEPITDPSNKQKIALRLTTKAKKILAYSIRKK